MKKLSTVFALTATIAMLSACGSGVSSSKDDVEASGTADYSIIQRTKDFFKSRSNRVSIEMPVSVLVVESSKDWLRERGITVQQNALFIDNSCHFSGVMRNKLRSIEGGLSKEEEPHYLSLTDYLRDALASYKNEQGLNDVEKEFIKNAKNIIAVKNDDAVCARLYISTASYPWSGWTENKIDFAGALYESGLISNAIHTEVIGQLGDKELWKSDTQIKNEINEIIDRMVRSDSYGNIAFNAFERARMNPTYSLNFGNQQSAPVHFSVDDYDVQGSSNGVSLIKSGTQWFGNGYISSKKYLTSVERMETSTMKKTKILSDQSKAESNESQGNSAKVGN